MLVESFLPGDGTWNAEVEASDKIKINNELLPQQT